MNIDNGFDLIIAIVFGLSPQLGVIGPKSQDLVIYSRLGEGGTIPQFHFRALQTRSENFLLKNETGKIKKPHR